MLPACNDNLQVLAGTLPLEPLWLHRPRDATWLFLTRWGSENPMAADLCNSMDISLTAACSPRSFHGSQGRKSRELLLSLSYPRYSLGYWKKDCQGIHNAEEQLTKEWNTFQLGLREQMGRAPVQGKSTDWVIRERPVPFVDLLLEDWVPHLGNFFNSHQEMFFIHNICV